VQESAFVSSDQVPSLRVEDEEEGRLGEAHPKIAPGDVARRGKAQIGQEFWIVGVFEGQKNGRSLVFRPQSCIRTCNARSSCLSRPASARATTATAAAAKGSHSTTTQASGSSRPATSAPTLATAGIAGQSSSR